MIPFHQKSPSLITIVSMVSERWVTLTPWWTLWEKWSTQCSWPESPVGHGWPGSLHALREPLLPTRYMAWPWPLLNVFPEDVPTSSKPIRSHLDMKCTGWPGGAVVVICWLDSDDGCRRGRSLRRGRFPSSCKIKTCISYTIIRLTRKIVKICNEINSCINTIWQVSISSEK